MRIRTAYPYETRHEDVRIPLSGGTSQAEGCGGGIQLYARIWRPLTDEPVPALLEYLPHRLTDATAARDWQRHPWYAGHGYASVRVDMRGHGNSDGVPGDAYAAAELADGAAVVGWLAEQPWCDGGVGMFGVGRGGTTALAVAALAPEPLKAVVTVCSTDDRYDHPGGWAHARSAALLAGTARPPDPLYAGDTWREVWLNRLQAVEPAIHTWLEHRTRDAYWKHGSVREEYGAIRAAVLAVGGWHDPYRDTVLRLVEHLDPARVRGLIGPWCHQYPDRGLPPGPAIGFLQETLRWWDHHLKGVTASDSASDSAPDSASGAGGVMDEPLLRSWIVGPHPPATTYAALPGRWTGDDAWPSPRTAPRVYAFQGPPVVVDSPQHTGVDAGSFVPAGGDADLPPDQREEDARSASFDFAVTGRTEILGRPRVRLRLRMDVPDGQAVARLCDVAPDGSSTLVTRGVLDLSARHGRDRCDAWPPGATEDVAFELTAIGHAFPPGHRIRLAVSSAYWPWIWPRAGTAGFTLDPEGSSLELPVRAPDDTAEAIGFGEPEQSEPLGVVTPVTLDEPRPGRLVVRDVAKGEWRLEADPGDGGTHVHPDGLEYTEEALDTYTIQERDPLSARARSERRIRLHRPDLAWDIRIESRSETSCDADGFLTSDELVCRHGQEVVFHRTWEKRIPRPAG
ncbi:CocE/NonD family hydrolase [Streptomyces formicae]|uniref:CocE/NonD family hydrolase n=1 Tax=Streptomyces formicae TaxID=1616117 RepID=A0ABY3WDP0_9ACTN|nr:CocE/NonD family hydrolase [Streptomyces formicae]UNM10682.1 CocE/NonD family hydrolase [Streptomyces formicae]